MASKLNKNDSADREQQAAQFFNLIPITLWNVDADTMKKASEFINNEADTKDKSTYVF
jgi:hypothetical protein